MWIQSALSVLEMTFPNFRVLDLAFLVILNVRIYIPIRLFRKWNRKKSLPDFKIYFRLKLFLYRVKTSASFKTHWNLSPWKIALSIVCISVVLNNIIPGIVSVCGPGVAHAGLHPCCLRLSYSWWAVSTLNRLCLWVSFGYHVMFLWP